jgi:hypothetical protein
VVALVSSWTARVEVMHTAETADELDDVLDDVMTRLADHGPAATLEGSDDGGGCVKVVLTFEARGLRDAVATALQLVESAVDEPASGVEVLPADVHAERIRVL